MELLKQAYNRDSYLDFLQEKFNFNLLLTVIAKDEKTVKSFEQLGFITTPDGKELPVFEIYIKPHTQLSRNRVQLRNLVAKQIEDGALAVYVDDENKQWRFSFIAIEYQLTEDGVSKTQTPSKRFTYLLGENTITKTAIERFEKLNQQSTLADLKEAFSVEQLNKEFYDKLYKWYEKAQQQVTFPNDEKTENHIQTSLIRLLTRLLFIWFLKEKKLINPDLFDKDKLQTLIDYGQPSSFYKAILQNLFFATLSTEIKNRKFRSEIRGHKGINPDFGNQYVFRYQKIFKKQNTIEYYFNTTPFLNGGLFDCLDDKINGKYIDGFSSTKKHQPSFPNRLFFNEDEKNLGLINLFNQYQFTIEESTPADIEVALDPELLGKVFENLLASYNPETGQQVRKATGSFYTPREIVSYMVDESLKQYFKQHTNLDGSQINDLFIEQEENKQGNIPDVQQIQKLIHAIDNLKILDPAVGSGAYPMGILQRLVFILEKTDPKNIYFKQQQIDKAKLIPDEASRKSEITAIEQVFSQATSTNTYGQKLYLIENGIYGVDIQPIAIQICKLRFFISLTIEQTPSPDETDNYGIKALPNLETKFIVANSLLPLGEMPEKETVDNDISALQKSLADVRHKHFSAKTLKSKRKYREQDKELRAQLSQKIETQYQKNAIWEEAKRIIDSEIRKLQGRKKVVTIKINEGKQGTLFPAEKLKTVTVRKQSLLHEIFVLEQSIAEKNRQLTEIIQEKDSIKTTALWSEAEQEAKSKEALIHAQSKKIAGWDLYNQNSIADWFDPKWQFGVTDGFDIVIGNPPYINVEQLSKNARKHIMSFFSTCEKRTDIYIAFFERSLMLCDVKGTVNFIVPHSFTTQKYGEKMRRLMLNNYAVHEIVDASTYRIFENALVYNIVIRVGQKPNKEILIRHYHSNDEFKDRPLGNNFVVKSSDFMQLKDCRFETKENVFRYIPLREKILQSSCMLIDICLIAYGARLNHKIKDIKKSHYISNKPIPNGKKFIEGRDIKRYHFNINGWLNYCPNEHYNPMFANLFESEKLMFINIVSDRLRFSYDPDGYYNSHTVINCVRLDLLQNESHISAMRAVKKGNINFAKKFDYKFLLGILNSQLINWYFMLFISEKLHCYPDDAKSLPIPVVSEEKQTEIIKLVNRIILSKNREHDADTTALETEIDQRVYKLYNLTEDEIKIIEKKL